MKFPYPVIFLPGVTGTYLRDEYPLPPESVWRVFEFEKDYERVKVHPYDSRYEAREPARVAPDTIHDIAYKELIDELRFSLRPDDAPDKPVPVYPFGYDWRLRLETIEDQLAQFIQEVINRTMLLPHYAAEPEFVNAPKVNLVAHSMGGLLITGYLARYGDKPLVNKVVTLATPYQGSFETVRMVTVGTGSPQAREAARLMPSTYYFLPSFPNCLEIERGLNIPNSLFEVEAWQSSVIDSLVKAFRSSGLCKDTDPPEKQPEQLAQVLFKDMLAAGKTHRDRVSGFQLAQAGLRPEDWLAVVGIGVKTRVRLGIKQGPTGAVEFDLDLLGDKGSANEWSDQTSNKRLTGDGVVPYEGAVPPFLPEANLVCVTEDDYEMWELRDKALLALSDFHAILPKMNMVGRLITCFLTDRASKHKNIWGRPAPGVSGKDWSPPPMLELPNKSEELKKRFL